MSTKKKTRYALLGLLSWKPMSGYDIKKIVDIGLSHFWNENYGQIYPTLDALVAEGLAKKSSDRNSKRKRFVYRITKLGETVFRDWLDQPTEPPSVRNELQLKFFLSSKLPVATSLKMIGAYRSQQLEILNEYRSSEAELRRALETGDYPEPVEDILTRQGSRATAKQKAKQAKIFLLTLRHGVRAVQARVAWCDEVIDGISA